MKKKAARKNVPRQRHGSPQMSSLEKVFAIKWRAIGGQVLQLEYRFDPLRRWRFDAAHPASMVAIEVEGGLHCGGRHIQAAGYEADCQKYNAAALLGWTVFRLTAKSLKGWENLEAIRRHIERLCPTT